jgi:hypothetical protein
MGDAMQSAGQAQRQPANKKPKYNMIIETPDQFAIFRILQLRAALRLECAGMKHSSGRSVCPVVKQMFGWKGKKESILAQLCEHIETMKAKAAMGS